MESLEPNKRVLWLFEARNRVASRGGFSRYLLISALGVVGALALLALGAMLPAHVAALRLGALVWFVVFGALRIALFWRKQHSPSRGSTPRSFI